VNSALARRFFSILESRMEPVSKTAPSRSNVDFA
jgi:hypothetical protein